MEQLKAAELAARRAAGRHDLVVELSPLDWRIVTQREADDRALRTVVRRFLTDTIVGCEAILVGPKNIAQTLRPECRYWYLLSVLAGASWRYPVEYSDADIVPLITGRSVLVATPDYWDVADRFSSFVELPAKAPFPVKMVTAAYQALEGQTTTDAVFIAAGKYSACWAALLPETVRAAASVYAMPALVDALRAPVEQAKSGVFAALYKVVTRGR